MASFMLDRRHKPEVCASKDVTRANLAQPWIIPNVGRMYATDGYMLVSIPAPVDMDVGPGECRTGPVSGELLKVGRKAHPKGAGPMYLSGDRAKLGSVTMPEIDPTGINFPDVDQVIPKFLPGEEGTISVPLDVGLLKKICEAIGDEKVILTFKVSDLDPAEGTTIALPHALRGAILVKRVLAEGAGDAFGLLMPIAANKADR